MEAVKAEWTLSNLRGVQVDVMAAMGLNPDGQPLQDPDSRKHRKVGEEGYKDPRQFRDLEREMQRASEEALRTPHEIPAEEWDSVVMPHMMGIDTVRREEQPHRPQEDPRASKLREAKRKRMEMLNQRKSPLRANLDDIPDLGDDSDGEW